ncbi:rCG58726 [Rattus norvegicus]|uniref:RCG58726 n=1 Tax=Rattus norvegicus TaxID=10116 RepID=A6JLA7_RAT|nr:rCG58726 [Rattus norvegicus]
MATIMALVALVAWDMAMVQALALGAIVAMATFVPLSMDCIGPLGFTEKIITTSEL